MRKCLFVMVLITVLLLTQGCHDPSDIDRTGQTEPSKSIGDVSGYSDILMDYETIVSYRLSDAFESDWNEGEYIEESATLTNAKKDETDERATHGVSLGEKWSYMIVGMVDGLENPTLKEFGYLFKDINRDAVPELFWVRKDGTILAVFTICDGDVILLDAFFPRYDCVVTNEGELYTFTGGGAAVNQYDIRVLSDGAELVGVHSFGTDWDSAGEGMVYYEIVNSQKVFVDEERFEGLLTEKPFSLGSEWNGSSISFFEP